MIQVSKVREDQGKYRFIARTEHKTKGYEAESKKKASIARAKLIKAAKLSGEKVYLMC